MNNRKPCKYHKIGIQRALACWYNKNHRDLPWRRTRDPYQIWVSEVMLQQTQVKTVLPYFKRFIRRFPDVARLAQANEQTILKFWEGLGYYARARNLHRAARQLMTDTGGRIPGDWKALQRLPGIGEYIAAAILSIAFDQPYAAVDGNVKRVLARMCAIKAPINQPFAHAHFKAAADELLNALQPGNHNQAMMEWGALICTPRNPKCSQCPATVYCKAYQTRTVSDYPQRIQRQAIPKYLLAAGVVRKKDHLLLVRRPINGLLGGLWEFPNGSMNANESAAQACARQVKTQVNLQVTVHNQVALVHHAYTHFKIQMTVFICHWHSGRIHLNGPIDFKWIRPYQIDNFALHKSVHKALSQIGKHLK